MKTEGGIVMGRKRYINNVFDEILNNINFDEIELKEPVIEQKIMDEDRKVRIISLDETGKFEHLWDEESNTKDFRCVGGVLVDVPLRKDNTITNSLINESIENELNKVYTFLCKLIEDFNQTIQEYEVIMPDSLHLGDVCLLETATGKLINKYYYNDNGNSVKDDSDKRNKIRGRFIKFVQENTTRFLFDNNYIPYGFILSKDQIEIDDINTSNIVDYRVGANLYEEMVINAVENNLFYDIREDVRYASIRMATRVFNPDEEEVGLYDVTKRGGKIKGFITNTNFIKTALMHKINDISFANNKIDVSFDVEKIDYRNESRLNETDWKNKQKELAFHYLSDIVCGILRYKYAYGKHGVLMEGFDNKYYEHELVEMSKDLNDEGYEIRFISESDRMFNRMYECVQKGALVDYYSIKYDFERRIRDKRPEISLVSKFYYEKKLPGLEKHLNERLDSDNYKEVIINKLPELYSLNNGLMGNPENKYEKGRYIALNMCNILETIEDKIKSDRYRDSYFFRFMDIVIRGFNHRGEISSLEPYLKQCNELGYSVGVEEYIDHRQRAIQFYFNSMQYDYIIKEYYKNAIGSYVDGKWNFSDIENLKESMKLISGRHNQGILFIGKIKSSLAQALAFERMSNAEIFFKEALEEMNGDKGNRDITLSYMLHHYLDMAQKSNRELYKEKYEKEGAEYFGVEVDSFTVSGLEKIFDVVMGNLKKNADLRFALFLFVKSIKVFYLEEYNNDKNFIGFIDKMSESILDHVSEINDMIHPWQLIFINMFEILNKTGNKAKDRYFDKIVDSLRVINNGPTITAIITKFKLDYMDNYVVSKDKDAIKLKEIPGFEEIEKKSNEEVKKQLEKKLTYMYN